MTGNMGASVCLPAMRSGTRKGSSAFSMAGWSRLPRIEKQPPRRRLKGRRSQEAFRGEKEPYPEVSRIRKAAPERLEQKMLPVRRKPSQRRRSGQRGIGARALGARMECGAASGGPDPRKSHRGAGGSGNRKNRFTDRQSTLASGGTKDQPRKCYRCDVYPKGRGGSTGTAGAGAGKTERPRPDCGNLPLHLSGTSGKDRQKNRPWQTTA